MDIDRVLQSLIDRVVVMSYDFKKVDAVVVLLPEGESIDGTEGERQLKEAIAQNKHIVVYLGKGEVMPKFLDEYGDKSVFSDMMAVVKAAREYIEAVPGEHIRINDVDGYTGEWKLI